MSVDNYVLASTQQADSPSPAIERVHPNDRIPYLSKVIRSPIFSGFIYFLIAVNLVTAGARNFPSTVHMSDTFEKVDIALSFCYLTEAILKIIVIGPGLGYFKSWWNVFDFVVVAVSMAGFGLEVSGGWSVGTGAGFAGVARIFRLIRLLSVSSKIQLLFTMVASSVRRLLNIVMLLALFLVLITLTAQEFFESSLSRRCQPVAVAAGIAMGTRGIVGFPEQQADAPICRYSSFPLEIGEQLLAFIQENNETLLRLNGNRSTTVDEIKSQILFRNNVDRYGRRGEFLKYIVESPWLLHGDKEDNDSFIGDVSLGMLAGQYVCPYDSLCVLGISPEKGKANFDSTPTSVALLYNVMTLEGWTAILYPLIDAQGTIVAGLFFAVIMGVGNFFIMNLTLVVILDAFERSAMLAEIVKKAVEDTVTSSQPSFDKDQHQLNGAEGLAPSMADTSSSRDAPAKKSLESKSDLGILKRASSYNDAGNSEEKAQHSRAVQFGALPYSDRGKWCGQYRTIRALCEWTYVSVVGTLWFRAVSTLVLLANLILETTAHGGMSQSHEDAIARANIAFIVFYISEVMLKFIAYPFPIWRSDAFNIFDCVVTFASAIELFASNTNTLSILRCMRFLKVVSLSSSLRLTLATLVAAFKGGLPILSLVLLIIYLTGVLGMQIFGGNECNLIDPTDPMKVNTALCDNVPRGNFDNIAYASQSMFIVASGEGWREIMSTTMVAVSDIAGAVFFTVSHFILGYIMVNLFVAVIINSATELKMQHAEIQMEEEEEEQRRQIQENENEEAALGDDVEPEAAESTIVEPARKRVHLSVEERTVDGERGYTPPCTVEKAPATVMVEENSAASQNEETSQENKSASPSAVIPIPMLVISPAVASLPLSASQRTPRIRSLSGGPRQAFDVGNDDMDGGGFTPRARAGSFRHVPASVSILTRIRNGVELLSDPTASATAITSLDKTPRRRPSVMRDPHHLSLTSNSAPSSVIPTATDSQQQNAEHSVDDSMDNTNNGSFENRTNVVASSKSFVGGGSNSDGMPVKEGVANIVQTIADAEKMSKNAQKRQAVHRTNSRSSNSSNYSDTDSATDGSRSSGSSSSSSSSSEAISEYTSEDDGQFSDRSSQQGTSKGTSRTNPNSAPRALTPVRCFQVFRLLCAWICLSPFLFLPVVGSTIAALAFQMAWKPMLAPDHPINQAGWYIDVVIMAVYVFEFLVKLSYFGIGVPKCVRKLFSRKYIRRNAFLKAICCCCVGPRQVKGKRRAANDEVDNGEELLMSSIDRRNAAFGTNKSKKPSGLAIAQRSAASSKNKALKCLSSIPLPRNKSYFSSGWHWLELFCTVASIVTVAAEAAREGIVSGGSLELLGSSDTTTAQRALRILWQVVLWGRILRNLRLWAFIRYSSPLYVLYKALLKSFTTLRNAAIITTLFWYMYSVWGLIMFRGKLSACTSFEELPIWEAISNNGGNRDGLDTFWKNTTVGGPLVEFAVGEHGDWGDVSYAPPHITSKSDCLAAGFLWLPNPGSNFENIGAAMIAMFQEATVSDWQFPMFTSTDSRSDTLSPSENSNLIAPIYFITFIIIMGQFLVNFIKSALIDGYFSTKSDIEEQYAELRKAKESAALERKLARERRKKILNARRGGQRAVLPSQPTEGSPVEPLIENGSFSGRNGGIASENSPQQTLRRSGRAEPQWDDEFATIDNDSIAGNLHFGLQSGSQSPSGSMMSGSQSNVTFRDPRNSTDARPWWWFSEISARSNAASAHNFAADELKGTNSDESGGFLAKIFNLRRERKINQFMMMLTSEERYFFQLYRYALYFARPPLAVSYTKASNPIRFALRRILRSRALELFQCGLAIFHIFLMSSMNWPSINENVGADSATLLYRESDAVMTDPMKYYVAGDVALTAVFIIIMLGKMVVYGFVPYVEKRRNWVDILINATTLTGCLFCIVAPGSVFWTATRILLFMRVWRIHYIFFADRGLLVQLQIMLDSARSFISVLTLMALLLSTFSSIGMVLFGKVKYTEGRDGFNTWAGFDTFFTGFFTLVRVATSDNWGGILSAASTSMPNCSPQLADCGEPVSAAIFCFIFIILGTWVALNLFTAVLMEGVVNAEGDDQFPIQENDVRQFQKRWKSLSKHDNGNVTLTLDELQLFLVLVPTRPLGLNSQFRNFIGALPLRSIAVACERELMSAGRQGHMNRFAKSESREDTTSSVSLNKSEKSSPQFKDTLAPPLQAAAPPKEPPKYSKRHEESQLVGVASATRVLMQMANVPVFAFAASSKDGPNSVADFTSIAAGSNVSQQPTLANVRRKDSPAAAADMTHYFVYPDDVFDALVRLHYGGAIPSSAERILNSQRYRRFRKKRLMELTSPQLGGTSESTRGLKWKPVEVTCVAVLMATVLLQRRWRQKKKHRNE